ncbi:Acyl-CoA dehydrogenase [Pseudovibrio axinellae]|uniref:Acyl-CoA dehydrogenase n=1 Tax=Pseudovibrio axinellae TaxID=989403 RepID=A0A165XYX3_9HYPH|nr:acyl-CoA dehydrogenase family protein [Pseudovibrio axinellae]KZL18255.1 Acyl-CoA dehydrogenase [Pseudovibrio axinellae]SER72251.1 acyl-CoA dehydrogenase [Pseudovibrio axinellae]
MELLNSEETLLKESAAGFMSENAPVQALRDIRDQKQELGFNKELHKTLADMGWFAMLLPEEAGGYDFGHRAAGLVAEEMGRNLTASPFLSTAVLSSIALRQSGGDQLAEWGPKIAAGDAVIAFAIDEGAKHSPSRIKATAEPEGNGFILNAKKRAVFDGFNADRLIVVAKSGENTGLFFVDPNAAEIEIERNAMLDSRNAANIQITNLHLDGKDMLCPLEKGAEVLEATLRSGRAIAASEQLGVAREVTERTTQYLMERKQFGIQIGMFQALQHRLADLYCRIEETASLISTALKAIDATADNAEELTRAAKAKAAKVTRVATEEAVQMHGGIGMTDEVDIGLFMKRDRVLTEMLGDSAHHIDFLLRKRGL